MGSATTEIQIGKEIVVHGCKLGEKHYKDPMKDVSLHLSIDEVTAEINPNYKNVIVWIKKASIKKYPICYCCVCLTQGIKNRDLHSHGTRTNSYCSDHYAAKMRKEQPDLACPNCEEGYMMSSMGDNCCSHCDYREPHVHDQPKMFPGFSGGDMKPIQTEPIIVNNEPIIPIFVCTCMSWNSPKEHEEMRKKKAEEKEKFIESAKEGMIF